MTQLDRRQFLHIAGAAGCDRRHRPRRAAVQPRGGSHHRRHADHRLPCAAAGLGPDDRPVFGQPAAHVDLQMRVRSVYRPECRPELPARPAHQMGLGRRRQDQNPPGSARRRQMAGRQARDGAGHHLEPAAGRRSGRPGIRCPSSWASIANLKGEGNVITGDVKQYMPDLFKWMAFLTAYVLPPHHYDKVRNGRLRKTADGFRPLYGGGIPARLLCAPESERRLLGRRTGLRDRRFQVRDRSVGAHRRDRKRPIGHDTQHPVRGVRPAEGQARPGRRRDAGVRHRHDLFQRCRPDDDITCARRR